MTEPLTPESRYLLEDWLDGDESAAEALVDRLHPLVSKLVQAHLPRREEVDDLLQDIFAKVFSRAAQYRADRPLEHWVARIAVSTCRDRLRHQRRRPTLLWSELAPEDRDGFERLAADPSASLLSPDEARSVLEGLLRGLKASERALVHWLDLEERSIAEVAELTGTPAPLVRLRAFRARQRLRKLAESLPKEQILP